MIGSANIPGPVCFDLPYNVASEPSFKSMSLSSQTSSALSNFKPILDAVLLEYKKKTGKDLLDQPLAIEVQRCDTVDATLAILRDHAEAFQQLKDGEQKFMERIGPLTEVLFAFSGTLGVGDFGLVILIRGDCEYALTYCTGVFPRKRSHRCHRCPSFCQLSCPCLVDPSHDKVYSQQRM